MSKITESINGQNVVIEGEDDKDNQRYKVTVSIDNNEVMWGGYNYKIGKSLGMTYLNLDDYMKMMLSNIKKNSTQI